MNNSIKNSSFTSTDIKDCFLKLADFKTGQGNTLPLTERFTVSNTDDGKLQLCYLGSFTITFQDNAHLLAYFIMLASKEISSKSAESLPKYCEHVSKGFLSLNHTDGKTVKTTVSLWYKLTPYHALFSTLGITGAESNGKGSKMTRLLCTPNNDTVKALIDAGFSNISPIVDGLAIVGLKCELPADVA